MLELTADNAPNYLRARGWIGPGPVRVEALAWGVSNAVLRVETPERTFIVKQSRTRLRTRDDWFSDLDRVYREQEVMEVLDPLLPSLTVPRVLFSDRPNYVFAMEHAPVEARVWKQTLLAGEIDLQVGERAGFVLGRIHQATADDPDLLRRFGDRTVFVQLRQDPFYRRVQERRPEVAAAIQPIIDRMASCKEALCHGDYSPKNILVHPSPLPLSPAAGERGRGEGGFTLVDYETACFGDPTMDLGFFLSHLILKSVRRLAQREEFYRLTRTFWRSYVQEARFRAPAELERRGIDHFAVCVLARIDGTSPVDYLPEEPRREAVRRLARRVLDERPERWEDVLTVCDSECARLR